MNTVLTRAAMLQPEIYRDNVLIDAFGLPLSRIEIAKQLLYLPPLPGDTVMAPAHMRKHELGAIRRIHIPTASGITLAESIEFMTCQGYVHRKPTDAKTWARLYGLGEVGPDQSPIQLAASVVGLSGAGKSVAVEKALRLRPQVVTHGQFPGFIGPVRQLLWLKIDVPGSGRIADLVESLTRTTDQALGTEYTKELYSGRQRSPATLAHEWIQKVSCHFLGLLVLDEVQNLFKIERKNVRQVLSRRGAERPALRIVDDQALKFLLTLTNATRWPMLVCGTPDGIEAFNTRMSTSQRLVTGGFHRIAHAETANDEFFRKMLFPRLCDYQWFSERLQPTEGLRELVHELSGGIPRICMLLWEHAHRRALDRDANCLSIDDFRYAAAHSLAPLQPSIQALLSGDPRRQVHYEDLLPTAAWNHG